jgi:hypothetical protein
MIEQNRRTNREAAKEKMREEARIIEKNLEEKQVAALAKELDDALFADASDGEKDEVRVSLMLLMGLISGDTDKQASDTAGGCRYRG